MLRLHCLFLLIFIALSNSVNLDIPCTNNTQCGEPSATCLVDTCRCIAPYYTPCGTSQCKIETKFAYEDDECRVDANCMDNADCSKTENRCRCKANYTRMNGLCYKSLNTNCTRSLECWSGECRNKICQCPLGSTPKNDNNRCERKPANIYENWAKANVSSDFCSPTDPYSCRVPSAVCRNDSQHLENFCQCPLTHTADYEKQECQLKLYSGLSPSKNTTSNTTLPLNECGKCQIDNALCAFVDHQATCWCQAGFTKNEDKCVKNQQSFIFPNRNDVNLHNYTLNCMLSKDNSLCSCAPGYQFINQTLTCQPIKPKWIDDRFEYGVCTHIDSKGKPIRNDGLCPAPLKCEPRQDKYVCSCGVDRYFDEENDACYYFLGRNLTTPNAAHCPKNSNLTDGKCQCEPNGIFSISADSKRCELKLNETGDSQEKPVCDTSNSTGDRLCAYIFGGNAKFCRMGECRCMMNSSYYANNTCATFIYAPTGINAICPTNAESRNGLCECKTGYRVELKNNRTYCVRKVDGLSEQMLSTENAFWNLTIDDCKALFPFQPINISNDTCICDEGASFNGTICVFSLGFPLTYSNLSTIQCPKNANSSLGSCQCNPGYKKMNDTTCDKWTTKVYQYNETIGENLINITSNDCISLFGSAADVSENETFCRCLDENLAFWNANKCYFLLDTNLGGIDPDSACPPDSKKTANQCVCPPGYQTNRFKTGCERKPIFSSDLQSINIHTFDIRCNASYTDEDCQVLHGPGAVCRDNQCHCDRSRSYVRNNTCELFSQYIFPGIHEYYLYTCDTHDDCGDHAEKNGIVCEYGNENYRVCQCKKDYYFNPIDSTCVENECFPECSTNEKCQNDRCVCNIGYYRNLSGQCVKYDRSWKLHEPCNETYGNTNTEGLECSFECEHVQCSFGYRNNGSNCVKYRFDDRCKHAPDLCINISPGSECDPMENKCICSSGYYQTNGIRICVRAAGLSCVNNLDCGEFGDCLNRTCICQAGRQEEEKIDSFGRKITICINGIDKIRFNSVLFFLIVIIRVLII